MRWFVTVLISLMLVSNGVVQANEWKNPGSGNWSTAGNWDFGEPSMYSLAYINNGGTAEIHSPNSETCFNLYLGEYSSESGIVDMSGGSLSAQNWLYIGQRGSGKLNIASGGVVSAGGEGYVGYESGAAGEIVVSGTDSMLTTTGNYKDLYVGYSGTGALSIEGGGSVTNYDDAYIAYNSNSGGDVVVDGGDSSWSNRSWLIVGRYGHGTLQITNGGTVTNGYQSRIGEQSGATGEVTVDGVDSTWTSTGDLQVGSFGDGILNITGGGSVSSSSGWISAYTSFSSKVVVSGKDSTWTMNPWYSSGGVLLSYGDLRNNGTLDITGGGSVSNASTAYIGAASGSTGEVTVDGENSTWAIGAGLYVGDYGTGKLHITGGGVVRNDGSAVISYRHGNSEVTVDGEGSTWTNLSDLRIGGYAAALTITDHGLVSVAGSLRIDTYNDFINMATGGMLALNGKGDDSLGDFLALINGTPAIRYWDNSILDWADITGAINGQDYTLSYLTDGDLAGYTMLTVESLSVVPEPSTLILLLGAIGSIAVARLRKGWTLRHSARSS